jgi:hypothetical protein
MAADVECGILTSEPYGVVERGTGRHQSGSGQDAVAMSFNDSLVHVACESEIVRIDDEKSHGR